jgi:hypothetical protein
VLVEVQDDGVLDSEFLEELEPPLDRPEQLDPRSEGDSWVRVERDDCLAKPRHAGGLDHLAMADVHAVEGADRHCAPRGLEVLDSSDDVQSADVHSTPRIG